MRRSLRAWPIVAFVALPVFPGLLSNSETRFTSGEAGRTVWDSVYSAAQAARGDTAYVKSCARCHGASLGGADQSPPLAGASFLGNWNALPLSELHSRIKTTMPSDSIGVLDGKLVTDVIAYLLKANGFPEGARELSTNTDSLAEIELRTRRP